MAWITVDLLEMVYQDLRECKTQKENKEDLLLKKFYFFYIYYFIGYV